MKYIKSSLLFLFFLLFQNVVISTSTSSSSELSSSSSISSTSTELLPLPSLSKLRNVIYEENSTFIDITLNSNINNSISDNYKISSISYFYNLHQHQTIFKYINNTKSYKQSTFEKSVCSFTLYKTSYTAVFLTNLQSTFLDLFGTNICNGSTFYKITQSGILINMGQQQNSNSSEGSNSNSNNNSNSHSNNSEEEEENNNNNSTIIIYKFKCNENEIFINLGCNNSNNNTSSNNNNNNNNNNNKSVCMFESKYACLQSKHFKFNQNKSQHIISIRKEHINNVKSTKSNIISINDGDKLIYLPPNIESVNYVKGGSISGIVVIKSSFIKEKLKLYKFKLGSMELPTNDQNDNVLVSICTENAILNLTRYSNNLISMELENEQSSTTHKLDANNLKPKLEIKQLGRDVIPYLQIICTSCIGSRLVGATTSKGEDFIITNTEMNVDFTEIVISGSLYLKETIEPYEISNLVYLDQWYNEPINSYIENGYLINLAVDGTTKIKFSGYYIPLKFNGMTWFSFQYKSWDGTIVPIGLSNIKPYQQGSYYIYEINSFKGTGIGIFSIIINKPEMINNNFTKIDQPPVTIIHNFNYSFPQPVISTISQTTPIGIGELTITGMNFYGPLSVWVDTDPISICTNISTSLDSTIIKCLLNSYTLAMDDKLFNTTVSVNGANSTLLGFNYLPEWQRKCPCKSELVGTCDGSLNCICNQGYGSYDCSIKLEKPQLPPLSTPLIPESTSFFSFLKMNSTSNIQFEISLYCLSVSDYNSPIPTVAIQNTSFSNSGSNGFEFHGNMGFNYFSNIFGNGIFYENNTSNTTTTNFNGVFLDTPNNSVLLKIGLNVKPTSIKSDYQLFFKVAVSIDGLAQTDTNAIETKGSNGKFLIIHKPSQSCLQFDFSNRYLINDNLNQGFAKFVNYSDFPANVKQLTEGVLSKYFGIQLVAKDRNDLNTSLEFASTFTVFKGVNNQDDDNGDGNNAKVMFILKITFTILFISMVLFIITIFVFKRKFNLNYLNYYYLRNRKSYDSLDGGASGGGGYGANSSFELDDIANVDGTPEEGYIESPNYSNYFNLAHEFIDSKATSEELDYQ